MTSFKARQSDVYSQSFIRLCSGAASALAYAAHIRTRSVFTRDNRLRLRYVVSGLFGAALVAGLYVGGEIETGASFPLRSPVMAAIEPTAGIADPASVGSTQVKALGLGFTEALLSHYRDQAGQIRRDHTAIESAGLMVASHEAAEAAKDKPVDVRLRVGAGDTLAGVLQDAGVDGDEANDVVRAVSRHFNVKNLKAGQALDLRLQPDGSNYNLSKVSFMLDPLRTLRVERKRDGSLSSNLDEKPVSEKRISQKVLIDGSVYGSADRAGLPDRITASAIRLFSYTVDFQRDIHQGDRLEVMYDSYNTDDGYVAKTGDIIFARMVVNGKDYSLYRYKSRDGQVDYYTPDGKSLRRSSGLMKTPVAFGRMSSGFGMRLHPVLGYTKMHKGVDFAAPVGTPVFASGDGVIEKASRFSSYGNYIRLRHSSKLSSAYAHLSRYAQGIRPGMRVKQGQVIGYVGTTGRSTGPHLHYELLVNGVQVNPGAVKFAVDNSLKGDDMKRFRQMIRSLDQEYVQQTGDSVKVASKE